MKYLSKVLLLALVFALCMTQTLAIASDSMLAQRMNQAYESGREVEAVFSAKLGEGLALFIPQQTYDVVQQLLTDTLIKTRWAKGENDQPVMGISLVISDVELLTGTARPLADGVAIETSLLPGRTVLIPYESLGEMSQQAPLPVQIDDETVAVFAAAFETYSGIAASWAMESEGLLAQSDEPVPGTAKRSDSAGSVKLRVTAEQLKDLLVRLTDAFEKDAEFQAALDSYLAASGGSESSIADIAAALSEGARGLVPQGGALTLDTYTGANGELVGLDIAMDPMFEGAPQTAFAQYDALDDDAHLIYDFQGRIGLAEGGQAATKVSYSVEESSEENSVSLDMLLRGMYQATSADQINQVTLTDKRETVLADGQERLADAIEFTVESLAPDGSQQAEGAMPMSAVISTLSITNEQSGADFDSDISVSLRALGMEFAVLGLRMQSGAFESADTSGNTLVNLSEASEEDQAALLQELQTGLGLALMNAMAVLPPELLQMMQGE